MIVLFPNFLGKLDLFCHFFGNNRGFGWLFLLFYGYTAESDEDRWCRPHLLYPDPNAQAETSGAFLSAVASITRRHGLDRIGKYVFIAGIDVIFYIIIL